MKHKNKVLRCFLDTDLRAQHLGLSKIAAKHRVYLESLAPGEHLIFINKKQNKMKMVSSTSVVSYLKLPDNERIDLRALQEIPRLFSGDVKLDYTASLKKMLSKKLVAWEG